MEAEVRILQHLYVGWGAAFPCAVVSSSEAVNGRATLYVAVGAQGSPGLHAAVEKNDALGVELSPGSEGDQYQGAVVFPGPPKRIFKIARWSVKSAKGADSASQACTKFRHEELCCSPTLRAEPRIVSTREACAKDHDCASVAQALETDFAGSDVLLLTPGQLGMRLSYQGQPTTLGDEWKVYQGLSVSCEAAGRDRLALQARADAGGGRVVFAAVVPKLPRSKIVCRCGEGN